MDTVEDSLSFMRNRVVLKTQKTSSTLSRTLIFKTRAGTLHIWQYYAERGWDSESKRPFWRAYKYSYAEGFQRKVGEFANEPSVIAWMDLECKVEPDQ
jgi:hypothetical protein